MGRADEVRQLLGRHRDAGGEAYMLSLTLPHRAGDQLGPMRRHVANAWRYCQTGAPWGRLKAKVDLVGTVRALEVKIGPNGWHPHLHVLLLVRRPLDAGRREELLTWLYERWAKAITRPNKDTGRRYGRPSREHGARLTVSYDDAYITKLGLADELAKGDFKARAGEHRTPLQLLADVRAREAPQDIALWCEYAREMHGAKQLTWSKGLRARYALADQTDAALGDQADTPAAVVAFIPADTWDRLVSWNTRLQLQLLAWVERAPSVDHAAYAVTWLLDRAEGRPPTPF